MERSARDSAATRKLGEHVRERVTGRLSVGAPVELVRLYLFRGQIVAAETDADIERYARMLLMQRLASQERVTAIVEEADRRTAFGLLFQGVPDSAVDRILTERFYQNVCEFVAAEHAPVFEALDAVFVDNLQLGHDAAQLIETSCAMWDTASALDARAMLVRGSSPPADPLHRMVLTVLGEEVWTVEELLAELPLEAVAARACLLDMLQVGSVTVPVDDDDDMLVEDVATDAVPRDLVTAERALEEIPLDLLEARMDSDLDLPDPEAPARLEDFEALTLDEDVSDLPTENAASSSSSNDGFKSWFGASHEVQDDDLEAFTDHDYDRGKDNAGGFSTDQHNLDKVEVAELPSPDIPEPAEPTARFSAPVLSETEAVEKIAVANEVLREIATAFDAAEGSGRGRAALQLLVDGSPSRYTPLLSDLRVGASGEVHGKTLLGNLWGRPSTEHRQLLNQTLVDLIERALSSAADELPEESFDDVLERVAGYRQRLGL